jgi:tetratricopeptide (TPR) repeat protein
MAKAYVAKGDPRRAGFMLSRAIEEAPETREPWVAMAELHYKMERWPDCYAAALRALSIEKRDEVYTQDPEVWAWKPHDLAAISAWNMGLVSEAKRHGATAVNLAPDDERLRENLRWYSGEKS